MGINMADNHPEALDNVNSITISQSIKDSMAGLSQQIEDAKDFADIIRYMCAPRPTYLQYSDYAIDNTPEIQNRQGMGEPLNDQHGYYDTSTNEY